MIKIGITGGIGTGKTTVCRIFELLGIPTYNADIRAKQLMTGNKKVKSEIIKLLGKDSYFRNSRLNRQYISSKVFNDNNLLALLNAIVHPAVALDFDEWVTKQRETSYVIKEAALLIESNSYKTLDKLIIVTADEDVRISRVVKRDKTTKVQVKKRMDAQMSETHKVKFGDFIIDNSGRISLISQVIEVHKLLLQLAK